MIRSSSALSAALVSVLLAGLAREARADEVRTTRAIDTRLAVGVAGGVAFEGGDEGLQDSLRLDLAYLWRRTHGFGPSATVWRWNNQSTSASNGAAATLVGVSGIVDLRGAARSGPFARLGLGLGVSFVAEGFDLPYAEDRTVTMESTTGAGVLYEASAGWRFAIGSSTYLTAALGLRGAALYHRAETVDGSPGNSTGSLSEKAMSLYSLDASLGIGFEL